MASVAVVHPRDVLIDSFNYSNKTLHPLISSSSTPSMNSRGRNPNSVPKSNSRVNSNFSYNSSFSESSNRRQKQSPQRKKGGGGGGGSSSSDLSKSPAKSNGSHLVIGQVKILKRGEALTDLTASSQKNSGGNNLVNEDEKKKFVNQGFTHRTARTKKDRDSHVVEKKTKKKKKKKDENRKFGDDALTGSTASFRKDNALFKKKKKDENQKFDKGSRGLIAEDLVAAAEAAKQIPMVDFYAGSAVIASPPPSSLPVPAFFKKKSSGVLTESNNNDHATSDLLRLLKLDL